MSGIRFLRSLRVASGVCALLVCIATAQARQSDQSVDQTQSYDDADQTPGRVARLAWLSGQVQFAPAGEDDWGSVQVNRPMVIGDRLLTGDDGRAVLEFGDASVRIAHDSAFDFLDLTDDNVQIELSQGTLNLAVRQLGDAENIEVDTPTIAFVAATPGVYRIDDSPDGTGSMVSVFRGSGVVYGENGASRQVAEGTSYRFNDSSLASVDVNGLPQADDFDRFCEARDANERRYAQQERQYVPPDMIGGDDLYQYGQWNAVPEYGNVWYPTAVPVGWAPYRYGHWAWIEPWGWTWIDGQPWGFAPFHYGRWVYVRNRWGWVPGPVHVRPVYAPALVAFVGGSGLSLSLRVGGGGPVGWFPLGPRDVYVPWFHASRRYFTNVNVTNIRNVYVNKTVINNFYGDYRAGRRPRGRHDYAYRNMPGAVTAVPRNVFAGARPVHSAALKLNRSRLARSEVAIRPGVNPGRASLGLHRATAHPAVLKGREPFAKPVIARHAPPPRPVSFATREKIIARQHGQPLTTAQLRDLRKALPATGPRHERVKVVPVAAAARASARPTKPVRNTVHPIPARNQPVRSAPRRPGELPSARFAPRGEALPRAAVIRPADKPLHHAPPAQLPVVKPLRQAPQSIDNPAVQQSEARQRLQTQQRQRQIREQAQRPEQQRAAQLQTQRMAREQQAQQQRTARLQAQQRSRQQATRQQTQSPQQRVREQQMQQQRNIQLQTEQRAREQQTQQQRRIEMQAEQRVREQSMQRQMQQQRSLQMQQQQRAAAVQRQQQMRRIPQPRNRPAAPRHEPPPKKHPPPSSGH